MNAYTAAQTLPENSVPIGILGLERSKKILGSLWFTSPDGRKQALNDAQELYDNLQRHYIKDIEQLAYLVFGTDIDQLFRAHDCPEDWQESEDYVTYGAKCFFVANCIVNGIVYCLLAYGVKDSGIKVFFRKVGLDSEFRGKLFGSVARVILTS